MSYFARVNIRMIVDKVISAEQEFINNLPDSANWIQTSYNTRGGIHYDTNTGQPSSDQSKALRKNYAGLGYRYDSTKDAFIPEKPYPSWTLNETTCQWEPPIARPTMPENANFAGYLWNEETQEWYPAG
jgi:hypothetical protein